MSQLQFKRLKPPETGSRMVAVGGVSGLHLHMTSTGARSWILRTMVNGKRKDIGLGSADEVGLGQARDRARQAKDEIWQGEDPVRVRKLRVAAEAARISFAEAADRYLETKLTEFRNPKHRQQWRSTLDTYAIPIIGELPVADVGIDDVLRVLGPLWQTKTETASRLRGRIENILSWAKVKGHRSGENPARWRSNLDATLPSPSKIKEVKHHPAVAVGELPEFWTLLCDREGIGAEALRFMLLTLGRVGEVRGARWSEIDSDAGLWTIPAERMKTRKEHRVPLSEAAVALLNAVPRLSDKHVFPGKRSAILSENTLSKVMTTVHTARGGMGFLDPESGEPAVPHGLRSSFRNWCAEQGIDRDMSEIALAHTVGSEVERAYRRTDMLERRRSLMEGWISFLIGQDNDNVVTLEDRA